MPKRLKLSLNSECCLWYDGKRGRRGDSKFSNRPVTFESNRIWTSDSNSNRMWKLRRSLSKSYIRCLWACIFSGHWDIGDVKARNGPKCEFFSNFWPILWNPLAKVDGSMPECAQVCALHKRPHLTLLRKTETVDGSVALGVIRKTGITSLNIWPTL